jgi:Zn-dependent peptidase ImmA (M78 family)|tara:strand:+ start:57 stop:500 length:444 start_codon:yes stop_codon:yes gene_type:complete
MNFKVFFTESEKKKNLEDVNKTLKKLPKKYRNLFKGFKFKFEADNTLNGDDKHVGLIDTEKKTITIAAPWNYGREFTLLHEIGHLVWAHLLEDDLKKKWNNIAKNTKNKMNDGLEELFCMAFANSFVKNKIGIHTHPKWENFIKELK